MPLDDAAVNNDVCADVVGDGNDHDNRGVWSNKFAHLNQGDSMDFDE